MSRCYACNAILTDFEATRKLVRDDGSVTYPDLCNTCFKASDLSKVVKVVEREDLATIDTADDFLDSYGEEEYE